MFVQVQCLTESSAVFLLGYLCEEDGYLCEWHAGQPSCRINNEREQSVPCVQTTVHPTEVLDDRKQTQAVGNPECRVETELPEWQQPFTEGLTRRIPVRRISS